MIRYKMDVLRELKEIGVTTYKLRIDKLMGERTIQQLRRGELVSWATINTLCDLLDCQPGDIVMYERETSE